MVARPTPKTATTGSVLRFSLRDMGKERGFIKWYRVGDNWREDELFSSEPLCKWAAWIDLVSMAEFKNGTTYRHGVEVETKRGCVYKSVRYLADRWRWSTNKVLRYLRTLEKQGKTETQKSNVINCISILNYERYQGDGDTNGDTNGDTSKNNKNNKEIKESKAAKAATSAGADAQAKATDSAKIDFNSFTEFFNKTMDEAGAQISRLRTISPKRKAALNARCREHGKTALAEVVRKAAVSDFLNGGGGRAFVADFDWLMRPNNFPKVLDGNYDNKDIKQKDNGNTDRNDSKENGLSPKDRAIRDANRRDRLAMGLDPDAKPKTYGSDYEF